MRNKEKDMKIQTKKLLDSQVMLLKERFRSIEEARKMYQSTLDIIAAELGVPKNELSKWSLSPNGQYLMPVKKDPQQPES